MKNVSVWEHATAGTLLDKFWSNITGAKGMTYQMHRPFYRLGPKLFSDPSGHEIFTAENITWILLHFFIGYQAMDNTCCSADSRTWAAWTCSKGSVVGFTRKMWCVKAERNKFVKSLVLKDSWIIHSTIRCSSVCIHIHCGHFRHPQNENIPIDVLTLSYVC
jgi:hypothetical protein